MDDASLFFAEKGSVHESLRKITRRLDDLGIPYAVVGGMALFFHGFRRFTEDVDLLIRKEDLKIIHEKLDGLGYVRPFALSKNLRDAEFGVKVEFLITGGFPGDGKPKPVAFPNPEQVAVEIRGIKCVNLPSLVELKLASGLTQPERVKDFGDVVSLIKELGLKRDFSGSLNPYVGPKFTELWDSVNVGKRFIKPWRFESATAPTNIAELANSLKFAAGELERMHEDGVAVDAERGVRGGFAYLVTSDPQIARKYDMHPDDEFVDPNDLTT